MSVSPKIAKEHDQVSFCGILITHISVRNSKCFCVGSYVEPCSFSHVKFFASIFSSAESCIYVFFLPSARGRHLSVLVVAGSIAELEQQSWFLLPNISFLLLQC
jgi:hypothetical protein